MKNFVLAIATLVGTIIGVGMFGLPFVAATSGSAPTLFYLVVLTGIVTLVHIVYGEIVLRTAEKHRLAGYAGLYLGRTGKFVGSFIFLANLYLASLAYLLVGGEFLRIVFSGWINFSAVTGSLILGVITFAIIFKGIRLTGFFEMLLTMVLLSLIASLAIYGAKFIDTKNLILFSSKSALFLPYGAILFALSGGSAIPEIRSFFSGRAKGYRSAIILGTIIPAVIYAIFIITVLGISGTRTSPEAINGLTYFLGNSFVRYGALAGFLAVITSFFTVGLNLKNSFSLDFKLPHSLSFILAVGVPLLLFFSGWANFITIISLAGGVLGGLEGLLILAVWSKAKKQGDRNPEYTVKLSRFFKYLLALVFLVGIVYGFIYTLK